MSLQGAGVKQGAQMVGGLLAGLGVTPQDAPLFFAVFIGLITGTLAAWPKERRRRKDLGISKTDWLMERLMLWGGIFVIVSAAATLVDLHVRVMGAFTFFLIYGGSEILDMLLGRFRKQIEKD